VVTRPYNVCIRYADFFIWNIDGGIDSPRQEQQPILLDTSQDEQQVYHEAGGSPDDAVIGLNLGGEDGNDGADDGDASRGQEDDAQYFDPS